MAIVNPALEKLLYYLDDCLSQHLNSFEDASNLYSELSIEQQLFERRISKQILGLSTKKTLLILEQLIFDFKNNRREFYIERSYPSKSGNSFATELINSEYDEAEDIWYKFYTSKALELSPEECKLTRVQSGVLAHKIAHKVFTGAYGQVLGYYEKIVGKEKSIEHILDRYDKHSEFIRLKESEECYITGKTDTTPLVDKVLAALSSEEIHFNKKDIYQLQSETAEQQLNAPLKWLGSGVELAALFVELDAKGYIRLPSANNFERTPWERICRAILGLFALTTQRSSSKGEAWLSFSRNFVSRAENEKTGELEYRKLHQARHKFRNIVPKNPVVDGTE